MLTITAVIRAKSGYENVLCAALLEVAEHVQANEPQTEGFFISRDLDDPAVFTTYERFADRAAMDTHNGSEVVARFFDIVKPIIEGEVVLVTSTELSAKKPGGHP